MRQKQSSPSSQTPTKTDDTPILKVQTAVEPNRRTATAQIRGDVIEVVLPKRWSQSFQKSITEKLVKRVQRQFYKDYQMMRQYQGPTLTFDTVGDLTAWIVAINAETLRVPLKGVRIGSSKYTRLAQMNIGTRIMTVSKYCLDEAPREALRYLIIHELAHLKVPDHSKAFWAQVDAYVPNRALQVKMIQATHRIRLYEAEAQKPPPSKPHASKGKPAPPPSEKQGFFQQLLLTLFD